jgi:hypothetical protein
LPNNNNLQVCWGKPMNNNRMHNTYGIRYDSRA